MNSLVTIIIIMIYYHGCGVSLGLKVFLGAKLSTKIVKKEICLQYFPHPVISWIQIWRLQQTMYQIWSESPKFCRRYYKKTFGLILSGHSVYAMAISDLQSGRWRTTTAHCTTRRRWRWTIGTDRWLLATPSSSRTRSHWPRRSPAAPTDRLCDTGCRNGGQVAATGRSGDATECGRRLVPTSPWRRPAPAAARRLRRR